ncbi:MAG: hypothetical protein HND51_22460 [Chloroflexi bacterium]|nr:hypothetical protein [Chloroflexota bacterium]
MRYKASLLLLFSVLVLVACQGQETAPAISSPVVQVEQATNTIVAVPETPEVLEPTVTIAVPTATEEGFTPDVRLNEGFEGTETCLETFERVEASAFVFEGRLIVDAISPETIVLSKCESLVAGDFVLEVDASVLEAPEEAPYYYGLTFRVSGEERYNFVIGSVGGFCAFFATGDGLIHLTNSTDFETNCWALPPADVFKEDSNNLRVVAVDDRLDFFINDVLMAVVRDNRLTEGNVGFIVTSGVDGGVRVAFDNLRVLRP